MLCALNALFQAVRQKPLQMLPLPALRRLPLAPLCDCSMDNLRLPRMPLPRRIRPIGKRGRIYFLDQKMGGRAQEC